MLEGDDYMKNEAVEALQKYLRQLSYDDLDIYPVPIDGIYDAATQQAVIVFQQKHGIDSNGIVDKNTWDKIYSEYLKSIIKYSYPATVSFFPRTTNKTISIGDKGFVVNVIQYMLQELSRDYGEKLYVEISGIYDSDTENSVREFQKVNLIDPNGIVDQNTWNRITEHYNKITNEYIQ